MSVPVPDQVEGEDPAERLGQTLEDRYRIDAVLGVGAMGSVYRARHLSLRKDVAVKLLHREMSSNEEIVARFDREAAGASRLDHPNCVRVMDFGRTLTGHSFLVMELLDGHDVASMIDGGQVPLHRTIEIIAQILSGLEHAHKQGIIHRDIKPENIFLNRNPDGVMVAKLVDFGIAKVEHGEGSTTLTKAGMVFGTPQYMSPEQALGRKIDVRTDLYSLGLVMYAMLTGDLPFDDEDPVAILKAQVKKPLPDLPDSVPDELKAFIQKMASKEPDDRYSDATAALDALREAVMPSGANAEAPRAPTVGSIEDAAAEEVAASNAPPSRSFVYEAKERARDLWMSIPQQWRLPVAAGGGVLLLAVVIAAFVGGDDSEAAAADDEDAETVAAEGGDGGSAEAKAADEGADEDAEEIVVDGDGAPSGDGGSQQPKGLSAGLSAVDQLILEKKYDSARITLGPLLDAYPKDSELHLRMGHVMNRLRGKTNVNKLAAMEAYRNALALDGTLLDDPGFQQEFFPLLDRGAFRVRSVEIAVELLGDQGLERLSTWVNVQKSPLPYPQRHLVLDHLRANGREEWINDALQTALDLWQAPLAEEPCVAFETALATAEKDPDSFLAGTIATVPIPEVADGEQCPDLAVKLANVQAMYLARFAGVKPVVPDAYRRRAKRR